ncbi:MAG: tryptophan-rich sensory protein [Actinobacteria bacterium]|nr:tryptophan-rich sensory protein [Actinomycetota bacterium]MCB8998260.1 tryptophan-rich sensory protein [Actinomycetota bacterium]MCB9415562.1 tryptophan-rich sensory protein [Actinomycetota bacterium]HRY08940.1 tryptophan-rich sensory protein [Candidatus Nanopelagicales bacterium]
MSKALLVAANLVVLAVYVVGSGLWVRTGGAWYRSLERPAWQPPDVVFGLIWPYNFLVLGVVGTLVALNLTAGRWLWIGTFTLSVAGALAWAYLFYVQQWPAASAWALAAAAVLTIPMVVVAFRFNVWAGVAMIPYQVWLVLATSLAVGYAALNPRS